MRARRRRSQKGFTLVEVMVAFAILSLLSTMVMAIAGQMLFFSSKIQGRNLALSFAQSKIEEMRSSLVIPSFYEDEPKYGYKRTVTSTIVPDTTSTPTNPQIIRFLRHVTVSVQLPQSAGGGAYSLETEIQTYRPQVAFQFPVIGESFVRSGVQTVLEGNLRDDGYNINREYVYVRTRENVNDNWTDWTDWVAISSSGGQLYTDPDHTYQAPSTLLLGNTYYYTFPVTPNRPDGQWVEIQFTAFNDAGVQCEQPLSPQGGTSYIKLAVDSTSPSITAFSLSPSSQVGATIPLEGAYLEVQDPVQGGIASDVYVSYVTLNKTTTPTQYWGVAPSSETPAWITSSPSPYYWAMIFTSSASQWAWSPLPLNPFSSDPPGTEYSISGYVVDKVIGRTSAFQTLIPVQWAPFGVGGRAWPDVNANFAQTGTLTLAIPANTPLTYTYTASWGESGTTPSTFTLPPRGIAVSRTGTVYIADPSGSDFQIKTYDLDGSFLGAWSGSPSKLTQATAVAVDAAGFVYVTDSGDDQVKKFTSDGTRLHLWDAGMSDPAGIAVSWDGSVYVVGKNGATAAALKFNYLGEVQSPFLVSGLSDPQGIAVDPWGFLYITDFSLGKVFKTNCGGQVLASWAVSKPWGIAADSSGYLYLANQANNKVEKYSRAGSLLASWNAAPVGSQGPVAIAVAPDGKVFVTSSAPQFVKSYTPY
ncbi:MAG: prepilin-type N-terminal cleavage/methylation domain-containing protein [Coprothermobacterota bacterium]|nr:prepilin-type N-terminal cleavage/methylation domain-containing protein [Coprothermobacterota bacterium]